MSNAEILLEVLRSTNAAGAVRDEMIVQLYRELAEIRDGLIDLDHAKVTRGQFEELHTRVNAMEADFDNRFALLAHDGRIDG